MFTVPKQGADGRYIARVSEPKFVQVNNVNIEGSFSDGDSVTIEFSDPSKIHDVDQIVMTAAKENSETWFGKKIPDKTLEAGYTGSLKSNKMIAEKAVSKGEYAIRAFNSDRTTLGLEDVPENAPCDIILEFAGVMFFKKSYSPVWKIVQVKLRPLPKQNRNKYTDECMFEDDPEASEPEAEPEDDEF